MESIPYYLHSSKNLKVVLKIRVDFVILFSLFVIRNFRGTCSLVKMLKGYMVRKRSGTPALIIYQHIKSISKHFRQQLHSTYHCSTPGPTRHLSHFYCNSFTFFETIKAAIYQWCPTFFVPRSTSQVATISRSTSSGSTSHTRHFQPTVASFTTLSCCSKTTQTLYVTSQTFPFFKHIYINLFDKQWPWYEPNRKTKPDTKKVNLWV